MHVKLSILIVRSKGKMPIDKTVGKPFFSVVTTTFLVNHFFHFYYLNMDILLNIYLRVLKFCIDDDNSFPERSVSQIFYLGLSFYFM